MMVDDDKPTMAERYARAATSSHLRAQEGRCDVDYLIAAGWLPDGLGAKLHRLRGEFDSVRAQLRSTEAQQPEWRKLVQDAELAAQQARERAAKDKAFEPPKALLEEPARIKAEAKNAALTERAMVLVRLKNLDAAKQALGNFASVLATKTVFMRDDRAVDVLTGRTLDAWLDPLCHSCDGRGFNGGTHRGEPKITCRACRGARMRRESLGQDAEERVFCGRLLDEIDGLLAHVDRLMAKFMDQFEATGTVDGVQLEPEAVTALRQRLAELRSAEAQRD